MLIDIAAPTDAEAIVTLVNAAYRGEKAARGWTHEAGLLDGQRTDVAAIRAALAGGAIILLGRDEAGSAPAACVSIEPKAAGEVWYLGMLTVDAARQAEGLGRTLLEAGENHAKAHGAQRIEMTVIHLRHALIAWYERRGYRLTGGTAPFPYDDERFGRPLRPDLHFVLLEKSLDAVERP